MKNEFQGQSFEKILRLGAMFTGGCCLVDTEATSQGGLNGVEQMHVMKYAILHTHHPERLKCGNLSLPTTGPVGCALSSLSP